MELLALFSRIILIGVFGLSAVTKLLDRAGARAAIEGFGVTGRLVPIGSVLLPLAELAVAAGLAVPVTLELGALGALSLLVLFIVGIAVNLARGNRPDCNCFGQLHSAPIGWRTVARNVVLAALAGLVLWRIPAWGSAASWSDDLSLTETSLVLAVTVLGLLALAQGWFSFSLLKQNGRILLKLDELERQPGDAEAGGARSQRQKNGLPIGDVAPEFSLPGLHGEVMTLGALRANGKPVLLLFTDPGCGPCNSLAPEVAEWQQTLSESFTVALISRQSVDDNLVKTQEHGLTQILLQTDYEVAEAYRYLGTPSAVLVDEDGHVANELVAGVDAIREMVADLTPDGEASSAASATGSLETGTPAPDFELADLSGRTVTLRDFRGENVLVLFWDPSCGFCERLLPELKAFEVAEGGAARLLIVSRGTIAENRTLGFASQVVIDNHFEVGSSFGASGTPMGVLIDAEGKVASSLAIGGEAVLQMARSGSPSPHQS